MSVTFARKPFWCERGSSTIAASSFLAQNMLRNIYTAVKGYVLKGLKRIKGMNYLGWRTHFHSHTLTFSRGFWIHKEQHTIVEREEKKRKERKRSWRRETHWKIQDPLDNIFFLLSLFESLVCNWILNVNFNSHGWLSLILLLGF